MPNSLNSEHLVQIDYKCHQQTTKVAASKESICVAPYTYVRACVLKIVHIQGKSHTVEIGVEIPKAGPIILPGSPQT